MNGSAGGVAKSAERLANFQHIANRMKKTGKRVATETNQRHRFFCRKNNFREKFVELFILNIYSTNILKINFTFMKFYKL